MKCNKKIEYINEENEEKLNKLPLGIYKYHYNEYQLYVLLHVRALGSITPISKTQNINKLPYRIIDNVIIYK